MSFVADVSEEHTASIIIRKDSINYHYLDPNQGQDHRWILHEDWSRVKVLAGLVYRLSGTSICGVSAKWEICRGKPKRREKILSEYHSAEDPTSTVQWLNSGLHYKEPAPNRLTDTCHGLLASVVWWLPCLPLNPRFVGSNPAQDDGFLREMEIRNTTAFGQ
jgi:hypothetical protein